jgi:DNA-binding NtrC family response regulator
LLAKGFLRDFCLDNGVRNKPIDDEVLDALAERPWPGNVRELRNVVERMAILSGDRITLDDLPAEGVLSQGRRDSVPASDFPAPVDDSGERLTLREYRGRAEKDYILRTLDEVGWNISRAATILGVERTNLHKKMRSYGIRRAEA